MRSILAKLALAIVALATVPLMCSSFQENAPIYDKDVHTIGRTPVNYPPLARQTRVGGVVVIRVKLDAQGKVVEATVISGNDLLIPNALANARTWQFAPNSRGAAVIVYNFKISCDKKLASFDPPNFVTSTACPPTLEP